MVREIRKKEELDEQLDQAGDKLVVVDFYAKWCGPCVAMYPKVEAMDKEQEGAVVFLKVNVDLAEELSAACGVNCMPTFIFYKNKEKVDEFSGADEDKLKTLVEKYK